MNLCWQRTRIVFCECNYLLQCVRTNVQLGSQKTMPSCMKLVIAWAQTDSDVTQIANNITQIVSEVIQIA